MTSELDPITLEIIANGLRSAADESYVALMKSAYSTNIKERRDHSTAICDPETAGSLCRRPTACRSTSPPWSG